MRDYVYQTDQWFDVLHDAFGYHVNFLKQEGLTLPYAVDRRYGIDNYFSLPLDTYGCTYRDFEFKGDAKDQARIELELTKKFAELPGIGYRYIVGYGHRNVWDGFNISPRSTELLALEDDEAMLWAQMHKDNRTSIKSAYKKWVSINQCETTELITQGKTGLSRKLIDAINEHMGHYYRPYTAYVKGVPVVAAVCFLYGDEMTYWASVNTKLGRETNANYLLLWNAIQDAKREGCTTFNFGASPKGADNLVKFKQSWRTVTFDYNVYYIAPQPIKTYLKVREWLRS